MRLEESLCTELRVLAPLKTLKLVRRIRRVICQSALCCCSRDYCWAGELVS